MLKGTKTDFIQSVNANNSNLTGVLVEVRFLY